MKKKVNKTPIVALSIGIFILLVFTLIAFNDQQIIGKSISDFEEFKEENNFNVFIEDSLDATECGRYKPVLFVEPRHQKVRAGQQATYDATVCNLDTTNCPPSKFGPKMFVLPTIEILPPRSSVREFWLEPQDCFTFQVYITSTQQIPPEEYTIRMKVGDVTSGGITPDRKTNNYEFIYEVINSWFW